MATQTGIQLAQSIRRKIEELKKVCEGIDESTASARRRDDGLKRNPFPLQPLKDPATVPMLQRFLDEEKSKDRP